MQNGQQPIITTLKCRNIGWKIKRTEFDIDSLRDLNITPTHARREINHFTQLTKKFNDLNLGFYKPKKDQCDVCFYYVQVIILLKETSMWTRNPRQQTKKMVDMQLLPWAFRIFCFAQKVQAVCFTKLSRGCRNFTLFDLHTIMNYFKNETIYN